MALFYLAKICFLCILLRAVHVFLIDTGTNYALTLDYNKRDLYFDKKLEVSFGLNGRENSKYHLKHSTMANVYDQPILGSIWRVDGFRQRKSKLKCHIGLWVTVIFSQRLFVYVQST